MARLVNPRNVQIEILRERKPWTQEQLSEYSGVSLRTIQRIEAGTPCYRYTLNKIAEALKVELSAIEDGETSPSPHVCNLRITLAIPYETFDQTTHLHMIIDYVERTIGGKVDLVSVEPGSTNVILQMFRGALHDLFADLSGTYFRDSTDIVAAITSIEVLDGDWQLFYNSPRL